MASHQALAENVALSVSAPVASFRQGPQPQAVRCGGRAPATALPTRLPAPTPARAPRAIELGLGRGAPLVNVAAFPGGSPNATAPSGSYAAVRQTGPGRRLVALPCGAGGHRQRRPWRVGPVGRRTVACGRSLSRCVATWGCRVRPRARATGPASFAVRRSEIVLRQRRAARWRTHPTHRPPRCPKTASAGAGAARTPAPPGGDHPPGSWRNDRAVAPRRTARPRDAAALRRPLGSPYAPRRPVPTGRSLQPRRTRSAE